jgi:hypothetical protein
MKHRSIALAYAEVVGRFLEGYGRQEQEGLPTKSYAPHESKNNHVDYQRAAPKVLQQDTHCLEG